VRAIRAATDCELEIFVHGALCVAYSGRCFSSEAMGRPQRQPGPMCAGRYLLSPDDLYTLRHIPEILQIGSALTCSAAGARITEPEQRSSMHVLLRTPAQLDVALDSLHPR